jgi:hypothetical protein
MTGIMKRTGRGVWEGSFVLGQGDPVTIERDLRDHLARISLLFASYEIATVADHLRVLVEIRTHIPGRGFGTDSAVIGNLEYVVSALIREAQPAPPPPRRSVYEWIREPAL